MIVDFDWQWLLVGLPVVFAVGWVTSRFDLRQFKRSERDSPRAYYKGLNLLLNDQHDKAIDAFIEAVQSDPDTSELHFALGNLFRRRGEFERAVRVHEHLLQRADLSLSDRQRAQHALAQDFMKAGLFDRAQAAFQALEGSSFDTDARLARLNLCERSRDWESAIAVAMTLERAGTGSFAHRIAHYQCELAQLAQDRGDNAAEESAIEKALLAAPQAVRPQVQQAQRLHRLRRPVDAMQTYARLRLSNPEAFIRVATDYAACARDAGAEAAARSLLHTLFAEQPTLDLLRALAALDGSAAGESAHLSTLLKSQPSLSAALELLDVPASHWPPSALSGLRDAVAKAAKPLQRYRCAACSFEAQRYFWQCPGCLSWDSFPSQRLEEL